jgi:hypothetical protein
LKYRVQNNVLGVEKLKEVQKSNALKILCRASVVQVENARQRYAFPNDARRKANGRLPSRLEREKNTFVVRQEKTHGNDSLSCAGK